LQQSLARSGIHLPLAILRLYAGRFCCARRRLANVEVELRALRPQTPAYRTALHAVAVLQASMWKTALPYPKKKAGLWFFL
jgi:hypothetical protein